MKRASCEELSPASKRHCRPSDPSAPETIKRPHHAPLSTPPSPMPTHSQCSHVQDAHQNAVCAPLPEHSAARSIIDWIYDTPSICNRSGDGVSSPVDDAHVSEDIMSESSRRREKRQARSCSPTKKGSQYRNTVLKPANVLVDVIHDLPSDIEALLPDDLRDILDLRPPGTDKTTQDNTEFGGRETELADKISELVAVYRDECRKLATKPGSEPEYRTHLYGDVIEKLAEIPLWDQTLSSICSDKLWCTPLKPPAPTPLMSLLWPTLPAHTVPARPQETSVNLPTEISPDSNALRLQPDGRPFNLAFSRLPTGPSESSASASELDDSITTPKPDITVGISREAFSPPHAGLLEYWQAGKAVFSDPHATQGDMRFPFFFIEAKGLATNGNLIGAQNQAAGGGACAIRLLDSLAKQDPGTGTPRIIFSSTTEGAVHELWVHYWLADDNGVVKYHMTCLGAWRTTLDRHAREYVTALAIILRWGVDVFYPQIKQALDRVLEAAITAT
ncbi:hypothetical protein BU24DRAFT_419917 [Aaosphaeria arxii CBS 175.79]|uniref:DUF7924 domain-containing protein n=1 Tax=Aaosphaeria arxii CBS 175.79 TaxID=1450172 RepID=A0A6A5XU33_9PLEO|nr:uncharacterized protein BU24DRAFT_419917 [Aaosphaeria arxii CBS 175.79]KAF2016865.1 hypothetical protein BU24DRAFT_419917 [Aaosphaeria arxii CBS 175.79]